MANRQANTFRGVLTVAAGYEAAIVLFWMAIFGLGAAIGQVNGEQVKSFVLVPIAFLIVPAAVTAAASYLLGTVEELLSCFIRIVLVGLLAVNMFAMFFYAMMASGGI